MEYNFREVEKKWQKYWAEKKTFRTELDRGKEKFYVLDMFPYPSGAGLHVGHPLGYIASDIYARYKRLCGFNVLHPMGYDAFGLPAEQYAIQTGQHPAVTTEQNIKRYREQLDKMGFSFDWTREVRTSDPQYYKWTQWIFLKLFNSWYNPETNKAELIERLTPGPSPRERGEEGKLPPWQKADWDSFSEKERSDVLMNYRLAYLSEAIVNWCPALGTVLANDEVKDGVSERGGYPVERKKMKQWSLRITAYSQRLLDDLETIDWSEAIKEQQRNWIGRSEGASVRFPIKEGSPSPLGRGLGGGVEIFTTRPDTIFGATFMTLAPEHELIEKITTREQRDAVLKYVEEAKNRSDRERMTDVKKVTGVFTGAFAINPFSQKEIPIWVADYVLAGYGTGAVMAVPAHDSRDHAFAKHFGLEIKQVIAPPPPKGGSAAMQTAQDDKKSDDQIPPLGGGGAWDIQKESYDSMDGKCINSDFLNGLPIKEALKKIISEIENRGLGKGKVNYRLRDAAFGRQRYWGEPIPIYYKDGIPLAVDEKDLPVVLPEVDKFLPTEDGEPPLARAKNWKYTPHPLTPSPKERGNEEAYPLETTTMPGWAGSSWYYLRYMDAGNEKEFASQETINYWRNVDLYIGGSEHATGHLLYVRFWAKFLFDLGLIPEKEPAKKLINQGMIQGVSEKIIKYAGFKDFPAPGFFAENVSANVLLINNSNEKIEELLLRDNGNPSKESYEIFYSYELFDKLASEKGHKFIIINVPIECVEKSILNFERHSSAMTSKQKKIFVCSGGYWKDGAFVRTNEVDNDKFYTNPEVEKMSKSKYNVVNPDDIIESQGADALRLYEMFLGPLELSKPWNTNGLSGTSNFIRKLWRLYHSSTPHPLTPSPKERGNEEAEFFVSDEAPDRKELKSLHKIIKKVTEDIERFSFNTSVSNFMICVNELTDMKCNKRAILEPLAILVSPYAPHIAEELWEKLGHDKTITYEKWPVYNEEYLTEDSFAYPISINGKTKMNLDLSLALSKEEVESEVLKTEEVKKYLQGQSPKKVIVVPGRIVNIVV